MPAPLIQLHNGMWIDPAEVVFISTRPDVGPDAGLPGVLIRFKASDALICLGCENQATAEIVRDQIADRVNQFGRQA